MKRPFLNALTDIPGLQVGQVQDTEALTGCTVVLCLDGATGGVDLRGGAPGTRETDLLRPMHLVEKVHGVLLTGGSAFGLDAASGVMRYLAEKNIGFDTGVARVPIVPAAVIFDLAVGRADIRPDATMGYQACLAAEPGAIKMGNFGAGCGATIGKVLGMAHCMKGGIGTASLDLGAGLFVAALVVVNAFGDVVDPSNGKILAGARSMSSGPLHIGTDGPFVNTLQTMRSLVGKASLSFAARGNTVIGVVATNALLNKEQANKVAQMSQDGLARVIRPAHTMLDGDTIFCLATGEKKADVNLIGAYAAEVVAMAILRGIHAARKLGGIPSAADLLEAF